MIEQMRQRIENAVNEMVNDLDKSCLRKMQADMHLCAAKCCQDVTSNMDSVQLCVSKCSGPVNKAQDHLHREINEFQEMLSRCVMQCNDNVKMQMPTKPSESEVAKFTEQFERCAVRCVDKHVEMIPSLLKNMKSTLHNISN